MGECEEAEAIGSSGQREKAHTVEPTYGKLSPVWVGDRRWDQMARDEFSQCVAPRIGRGSFFGRQENLLPSKEAVN